MAKDTNTENIYDMLFLRLEAANERLLFCDTKGHLFDGTVPNPWVEPANNKNIKKEADEDIQHIQDIIRIIGGIPIRTLSESGEPVMGRVTELSRSSGANWRFTFYETQHPVYEPGNLISATLVGTTSLLRARYLEAIASNENREAAGL